MGWYDFNKLQLSSLYGIQLRPRGYGRVYHLAQRSGWDALIIQGIRLRLKYPLWREGDYYIMKCAAFRNLS